MRLLSWQILVSLLVVIGVITIGIGASYYNYKNETLFFNQTSIMERDAYKIISSLELNSADNIFVLGDYVDEHTFREDLANRNFTESGEEYYAYIQSIDSKTIAWYSGAPNTDSLANEPRHSDVEKLSFSIFKLPQPLVGDTPFKGILQPTINNSNDKFQNKDRDFIIYARNLNYGGQYFILVLARSSASLKRTNEELANAQDKEQLTNSINLHALAKNPTIICMLAWSVFWLSVSQANRLRVTVGNEMQARVSSPATFFWLSRLTILLVSLLVGLGAYTQYIIKKHELPDVYQWKAMTWVIGINLPTPTFVEIPAGSFEMGDDHGDESEKPVHRITFSETFLIAQHEITFTQYDYFIWQMKQAGFIDIKYPDDEDWGRSERPVINLTWEESNTYINWLNQNDFHDCRLPSESEWEYAAKAGSKTKYFWGNFASSDHANYSNMLDDMGKDQWDNTAPVKQFSPNNFGLYDMSGNVHEWVQDRYHKDYQGAPKDGSAWESGSNTSRVVRGGSWNDEPHKLRSTSRRSVTLGSSHVGFRIVCTQIGNHPQ